MCAYSDDKRPLIYIQVSPLKKPSFKCLKEALIDSGASMSAIPPSMVNNLGLEVFDEKAVGTAKRREIFQTYLVNIEFHGKVFEREVLGIAYETNPIIGRDILNHFHICLDGKKERFEFIDDEEQSKS